MIQGHGTQSYKKLDLPNQRNSSIGYTKIIAAHKATLGQTGINLLSLTVPPEMTANGFVQPTTAQLQNASLLFYKNNLTLLSSLRGILASSLSYVVASSTQINFVDFTAEDGEIFTIIVDYSVTNGLKVVDAERIFATGPVAINTTDFNVGTPFKVGQNISSQIGGVYVFSDGVLQFRNTGNSSTVLDGNYYEVDAGGGLGTLIRFNSVDPESERNITVVSTDLLMERPDGSMMAAIENINGQIQNMAVYVADSTGNSTTTVLGAAPSNVDLKAFGDRVIDLENNRARIDQSNTWTAYQPLIAKSDGTAFGVGNVGQLISANPPSPVSVGASGAYVTITSVLLPAGNWRVTALVHFLMSSAITGAGVYSVALSLNPTSLDNANSGGLLQVYGITTLAALSQTIFMPVGTRYFSFATPTTVYLVGRLDYSTQTGASFNTASHIDAEKA